MGNNICVFRQKIPIRGIDLDRELTYYRSIRHSACYFYEAPVKAAQNPTQTLTQSRMYEDFQGNVKFVISHLARS